MHQESIERMEKIADKYLLRDKKVLDVGSKAHEGHKTYRYIFNDYTGYDIEDGENVDMVGPLYTIPIPDRYYDVVISGQTLEHVPNMFAWVTELERLAKSYVVLIAPANGWLEHRYPVDCWRVYPDGMKFLFEQAGLDPIEVRLEQCRDKRFWQTWGVACVRGR